MADFCPLLTLLSLAYGAAAVGLLVALVTRAVIRTERRAPSYAEATWCAFLPMVSVLLLPMISVCQPGGFSVLDAGHHVWHHWQQSLLVVPWVHGSLHVANYLLLGFAAWAAIRTVLALAKLRACGRMLRSTARIQNEAVDGLPVYVLPTTRPACFTWGLLKPVVYVSAGLLERLQPRDRAAMFAHEVAHARRRDGLTRTIFAACYSFLGLPGIRLLCSDWERAAERVCDAEAARSIGSACDVAAALVRVSLLVSEDTRAFGNAPCFAAYRDDIDGRVQALLTFSPTTRQSAPRRTAVLALLLGAAVIAVADLSLPHLVELFVRH